MPPIVAEVTAQITKDPNIRAYNTRLEMCSHPQHGARGDAKELNEFGQMFLAIHGINEVHLCPYLMLITKAPLFEWPEVEPKIEHILKEFVRSQKQLQAFIEEDFRLDGPVH